MKGSSTRLYQGGSGGKSHPFISLPMAPPFDEGQKDDTCERRIDGGEQPPADVSYTEFCNWGESYFFAAVGSQQTAFSRKSSGGPPPVRNSWQMPPAYKASGALSGAASIFDERWNNNDCRAGRGRRFRVGTAPKNHRLVLGARCAAVRSPSRQRTHGSRSRSPGSVAA